MSVIGRSPEGEVARWTVGLFSSSLVLFGVALFVLLKPANLMSPTGVALACFGGVLIWLWLTLDNIERYDAAKRRRIWVATLVVTVIEAMAAVVLVESFYGLVFLIPELLGAALCVFALLRFHRSRAVA